MTTDLMELAAVERQKTVLAMQSRAEMVAVKAAQIVVTDAESDQLAVEFVIEIAAAQKGTEKLRLLFTAPLNKHVKDLNALFKKSAGPLADAKKVVVGKRRVYFLEQKRKEREEEERIREENERREVERLRLEAVAVAKNAPPPEPAPEFEPIVAKPPEPAKTIRGSGGGSSTMRSHWDFKITDREKVPFPKYWILDHPEIRKAVDAGIREIPGVRIFEDVIVATRTG